MADTIATEKVTARSDVVEPFDAFISYRQVEPDKTIATRLHLLLETYKGPKSLTKAGVRRKLNRIFIDRHEAQSGGLTERIANAIEQSRFLIVICSPKARESAWISREVELFLRKHDVNSILPVLIEGEIEKSFPESLLEVSASKTDVGLVDLYAADIRADSITKSISILKREKLRLLATLLGCSYDDLVRREAQRIFRRKVAAAIALAFPVMAALVTFFVSRTNRYQVWRTNAEMAAVVQQAGNNATAYPWWGEALLSEGSDQEAVATVARLPDPGARAKAQIKLAVQAHAWKHESVVPSLVDAAIASAREKQIITSDIQPLISSFNDGPFEAVAAGLIAIGQKDRADSVFSEAFEKYRVLRDQTLRTNLISGLVTSALLHGRNELAAHFSKEVPESPRSSELLASLLCGAGNCDAAVQRANEQKGVARENALIPVAFKIVMFGNETKGIEMISTFTSVDRKEKAVTTISRYFALREQPEKALTFISILPRERSDELKVATAEVLLTNGKSASSVSRLVKAIDDGARKQEADVTLAKAFVNEGKLSDAKAVAESLQDPKLKAEALTVVGEALVKMKDIKNGSIVLSEAASSLEGLPQSVGKSLAQIELAHALTIIGDKAKADATLNDAISAMKRKSVPQQCAIFLRVGTSFVDLGERKQADQYFSMALRLLNDATKVSTENHDDVLSKWEALFKAEGSFDLAADAIRDYNDESKRVAGLIELANDLLEAKETTRALKLAIEASREAQEIQGSLRRTYACQVVEILVRAGRYRDARIQSSYCSPLNKAFVFSEIIEMAHGLAPQESLESMGIFGDIANNSL